MTGMFPVIKGSHDRDLLADLGRHLTFELCECWAIALCGGCDYTRGQDQCRRPGYNNYFRVASFGRYSRIPFGDSWTKPLLPN
jgi:hypothetical protein